MPLLTFYPQLSLVRDALKGSHARVFLVGGALRDYYLNRKGADFDFAVDRAAPYVEVGDVIGHGFTVGVVGQQGQPMRPALLQFHLQPVIVEIADGGFVFELRKIRVWEYRSFAWSREVALVEVADGPFVVPVIAHPSSIHQQVGGHGVLESGAVVFDVGRPQVGIDNA